MKVYTHYAALAWPIQRAGYEPVLLEPVIIEDGPVKVAAVPGSPGEILVVSPNMRPLLLTVQKE